LTNTILFVDDETTLRTFLAKTLRRDGYEVLEAESLASAWDVLNTQWVDIVILDRLLPDGEGLALLKELHKSDSQVPVIMLTAHGAIDNAVAAMQMGAYDYMTKPVDTEALRARLRRISETISLRQELDHLRKQSRFEDEQWIIGQTPTMTRVAREIEQVAPTNATVLITGDSGTGKEVVARVIHRQSRRFDRPFRPINCAAIPDHLLENELFGHEANAYTGAGKQRKGLFEVTDGGTLFLDEISCMRPEMQAKLLRVLQERTIRRLGGANDVSVDIRLLSATNQDLEKAIRDGLFRQDLFYRLSVVQIHLPPLRERIADIPAFAAVFLDQFNREMGKSIQGVSPAALSALRNHTWPGNIRELRNVLERAAVFCEAEQIELSHLPRDIVGD
jgi:DNA-binding NtrC family response regulator